ncbi:MAG TPA: SRPBCC family protein [Gemmatimonadales bacterium]|nr:SRPBCC family protein [Gemmatimonadales bacterium]
MRKTVTIRRPMEELFEVWQDLERLPEFMEHVQSVTRRDGRSHWVVEAPAGRVVEWDAEWMVERPNMIAWRSLPGSDIQHEGEVLFSPAPEDRGTEVRVVLRYDPPAGNAGAMVATLFGEEPAQQINADLHRFKQLMEVGFIPSTDGQPHGDR